MSENRCINNLLKLIYLLQQNSINKECCDNDCARPYLGPTCNSICYNTRPISIYNKEGDMFTITTDEGESSIFRVERVKNSCVTLRALVTNNDDGYTSTNTFTTVDTGCICVVRCHNDVVISNL